MCVFCFLSLGACIIALLFMFFLDRHTIKHLAYQPLHTRNKHLQQKWDKASYELHRGKVKTNISFF